MCEWLVARLDATIDSLNGDLVVSTAKILVGMSGYVTLVGLLAMSVLAVRASSTWTTGAGGADDCAAFRPTRQSRSAQRMAKAIGGPFDRLAAFVAAGTAVTNAARPYVPSA